MAASMKSTDHSRRKVITSNTPRREHQRLVRRSRSTPGILAALVLAVPLALASLISHNQAAATLPATGQQITVNHGITDDAAVADIVVATQTMGLQMLSTQGNSVVSPSSLAVSLSMLAEGARGETLTELETILGTSGVSRQYAITALRNSLLPLAGDPAVVQAAELPETPVVHLATQVAIDDQLIPNNDYVQLLQQLYGATVIHTDLGPYGDLSALNSWVRQNSGGLIERSAIRPDEQLRLVLQDAIVLAAGWASPFSESATSPLPFALLDGSDVLVPTMTQVLDAVTVELDGWRALRLPYAGGELHADVILPPSGIDPGTLSPALLGRLDQGLRQGSNQLVSVRLPTLDLSPGELDLVPVLQALGAEMVLDGERADLTGIGSDVDEFNLYLGQAFQQAVFQLNEGGVRAAAVTELGVVALTKAPALLPDPLEFFVDRPFLVNVAHTETSWPLFLTAVRNPG